MRQKKTTSSLFAFTVIVFVLLVGCNTTSNPIVEITTPEGPISIEVFADKAPITSANFITLVKQGVYNSGKMYRVVRMDNQPKNKVKIEVIQGGLFEDSLINLQTPILHETTEKTGILHKNGVISMARVEPGSASSEFFICIGDQPSLDYGGKRNADGQGFAAFGKVIEGMHIVKNIQQLADTDQYLITPMPFNIQLQSEY